MNKIVGDMGLIKGQDGFVGLVEDLQGELSWRNDPMLVVDKFTKITAQVEGTAWAMPQDQFSTDGINPARPRADRLTPWRVECFGNLSADTLAIRDLMRPHSMVEVPLVQGGLCHVPFEVTAKEWCRMLVAEVAHSSQAQKRSTVALAEITLLKGLSWVTAACRLVLQVRAATADETMPHTLEKVYFWRYAPGRQVAKLCERAVNLFFPSASDRNGMESLLVQVETDVKQHLNPVHVKDGKPLSECTLRLGEVSNGIFYSFKTLLTQCSRYLLATMQAGRSRDSVPALSQSQQLPLGPSGASRYPPKKERRRWGKLPTRELPKAWRKNIEALRDSTCAALAAVDRGLLSEEEEEDEEEEETLGNRAHAAAFPHVRASTPGAHKTPFVSRKGDGNDRSNKRSRDNADNMTE